MNNKNDKQSNDKINALKNKLSIFDKAIAVLEKKIKQEQRYEK